MYVSNDTATAKEMNMVIYEFDHGEKKKFDTDDENLLSSYENTFYATCGYDMSWDKLMPVVLKLIWMNKFFFTHDKYIGYSCNIDHEHGVGEENIIIQFNLYRPDRMHYLYGGFPFGEDPLKAVYYSVYESIKKMK
jgi:hypothetical protein